MFSTGQLSFAVFFIVAFAIAMVITYRKDKKLHKKNYKGVTYILLTFVGFVVFLFLIKHLLK